MKIILLTIMHKILIKVFEVESPLKQFGNLI